MEAEITEEDVTVEVQDDVVVEEVEEETEEKTEEEPLWQSKPDDTENVPLASFLKTKRKLKGQVEERDAELEQLRKENETLKSTAPAETFKRPRTGDFETDEEYEDAMDKYEDNRFNNISKNLTQSNTQKSQQEKQQQKIGSAVNSHYERAEELVKTTGMDPSVYKTADSNVRQAVEAVLPNQGDQSVNYLISILGDDSEKVIYYLGNNKAKLAEFQSKLIDDPNGLEAAKFLGGLEQNIKTNIKSSRAPKPAVSVSGDVVPKSKGSAERKKYEAAIKKNDAQMAYNIRKAAKKAGHDTKEWR